MIAAVTHPLSIRACVAIWAASLMLFGSLGQVQLAQAQGSIAWDRTANIKDAATRLGQLHRRGGSQAVLKFLDACYRTHMLASEFNQGLESCMAQDFMHTQVLAQIYARVPENELKSKNVPTPKLIADGMGQRFQAVFSQYKISKDDALAFQKRVANDGLPIFVAAVFPKGAPKEGAREPEQK